MNAAVQEIPSRELKRGRDLLCLIRVGKKRILTLINYILPDEEYSA